MPCAYCKGQHDSDSCPWYARARSYFKSKDLKESYQGGSPAVLLYPTSGTTIDYPYLKHKSLGLGMEIGRSFRPTYAEVEKMWTDIKPNLLYLLNVSSTPLGK